MLPADDPSICGRPVWTQHCGAQCTVFVDEVWVSTANPLSVNTVHKGQCGVNKVSVNHIQEAPIH